MVHHEIKWKEGARREKNKEKNKEEKVKQRRGKAVVLTYPWRGG